MQVDYVEVDVVVTDQQGKFVNNLRKEDFQILEDGKPQTVTIFSPVDLIIERPVRPLFASTPIEPDVRTNDREFDGRVYVLVLDDLHTSLLRTNRVKAAAKRFIEQYAGVNDLVAVVHTSGRSDAGQEFTNSRRLLLAAVDKFMPRKLRSSLAERIDEYNRQRSTQAPGSSSDSSNRDPIRDPLDFERGYYARMTLETLQHVADAVAGIRGRRKAVVFISEGIDYNITNPFEFRDATTIIDETREAISAATRANVSFYGIDPRGLTSLAEEEMDIGAYPEDPTLGLTSTELRNELQRSQDSLRTLAEETGGFAAVNANEYAEAFDRLVRENSTYYLLGYYPANDRRDGRFRKIQVKIAGRPDLKVRARKGYVAERRKGKETRVTDGADQEIPAVLRELQDSPVPVSGLRLAVTAAAFKYAPPTATAGAKGPAPKPSKGPAPTASVVVTVQADGRDLQFPEQDVTVKGERQRLRLGKLDVSVMALDREAKIRGGDRPTLDMKLRPQTYENIIRNGVATVSKLDLPAGRYQLRIAARESGTGRAGSVHYDVEVPDFAKQPISISGLALTSSRAARTMTADTSDQVRTFLPLLPTVRREFATDDVVGVFAEIYDNVTKPHGIDIATTLRADDGTVAFSSREEHHTQELQGSRGGFGHGVEVPLSGIAPGLYVLRVEARSRLDNATVTRETSVTVVAASQPPASR